MKSAQNNGSFVEKTKKQNRYKIKLLLSKSYFEDNYGKNGIYRPHLAKKQFETIPHGN